MTRANDIASDHLRPDNADLGRLLAGEHHDPHSILGAHEYGDHTVIRALRPWATEVVALIGGERFPFTHVETGLFAVAVPFTDLIDYRIEVSYPGGDSPVVHTAADPYRFLPTLGEVDLHLFAEGRHERLWEILGAHPRSFTTPDGVVEGVSFAVWAPNAKGVSLVGEFNHWEGDEAPLRVLGSTGVWELFWPGFPVDGLYKFRVHGIDGSVVDRADPMAFATEVPPQTASRVTVERLRLGRRRLDGRPRAEEPGVRADEHLRGAPDVVAPRPELPPAGRPNSPNTWWRKGSPTSNCCPSPSTRSARRGATRSRRTTRRRRDWELLTISDTSSTSCTRQASA